MTLKEQVETLLLQQELIKNEEYRQLTHNVLTSFGVKEDSEFYELYIKYFLGVLEHRSGVPEMIDPCPPQGFYAATYVHENWGIPKNYILFTTGEGEGGYLYNIEDNSVWDFTLEQQNLLGTDALKHWNSFYEFMVWYLTLDDAE